MARLNNAGGAHTFKVDHTICAKITAEGVRRNTTVTTTNTNANTTITAAQLKGGIIVRDPNGGARTDTLPTAALLVAALKEPSIGDTITCRYINSADAAETITLAAGSGGTLVGYSDLAQNVAATLDIRLTGVAVGSEAYVAYRI